MAAPALQLHAQVKAKSKTDNVELRQGLCLLLWYKS